MKKRLTFAIVYFISQLTFAQDATVPVPVDPKYMGEYPMVLISNGSTLYASLLSTYKVPRNVQLIYEVENRNFPLLSLVRDAELVTIVPKPFNLEHLLRGEKLKVTADVYMGHFERQGLLTYKNIDITLDKQLYLRMLDKPEQSNIIQKYDTAPLKNNQRLLVHQIQTSPSYAHIILLFDNISCLTAFTTTSAVPSANEIHRKLAFCGSIKPLYYDDQGFE